MAAKKLVLHIEDEIRCSLYGLDKEHMRLFVEAYSMFAPNYFFNPQYKLGNWDGRIRFFTWKGQTYNTLIPEIVPALGKLGYKVEIQDDRDSAFFEPPLIDEDYFSHIINAEGEPVILRDYQVRFANNLMAAGNGIGVACTSSGKTFLCAAICDSYAKVGATSIVIVPNTDLIRQTRREFEFLGVETGEYSGKVKDTNGKAIVISTWQALKNNPTIVTDRHVVLVDECLAGNTKISMADGSEKEIVDISPGDVVMSYNIDSCEREPHPVVKLHTNLMKSELETMYKLEFDDGTVLEVTGNHEVYTTVGKVRADMLTDSHDVICYREA